VPETEGPTCTTCLTLNPVGAPACIRCNQPLPTQGPPARPAPASGPGGSPTDWPGGPPPGAAPSPAAAAMASQFPSPTPTPRGLAVPPKGTPGGSRSAAAAVQPPGYGLGTEDDPADQAGPSPAQQRRISRRIAIVGGIVVLLVLAGGGAALWLTRPRYVDTDTVADRIGTELTQRLHETIVVRCPGSPRQRGGETFRCTASNGRGITQSVQVTVLDAAGRYEWTLG
jgi:hypothetical protein